MNARLRLCVLALLAAPAVAMAADPTPDPFATPSPNKAVPIITTAPKTPDPDVLSGRKRPGYQPTYPDEVIQTNPDAVEAPPPSAFPTDQIPVPDRWRLAAALGLVHPNYFDPYNQNTLKGDRPIKGTKDWFINLNLISDTVFLPSSTPTGITPQTTQRPGTLDTFGRGGFFNFDQTFIIGASLIKGNTAFKTPDWTITSAIAINLNYAHAPERGLLSVNPSYGLDRVDGQVSLQEMFVEHHLRTVSDRYDFDAVRVGIQPFNSDFRGFLFQDSQLGVRFFGNRDGNRFQYNLAFFWRLDKDTNSGLNLVTKTPRKDYIFVANLYRQDFPFPGLTSQGTVIYDMDREASDVEFNTNGFPVIPSLIADNRARDYDVVYLGYNTDGHWGRLNLTSSAYLALGEDRNNVFTNKSATIRSYFFAAEPSMDFDWVRIRLSGMYASGSGNPRGNTETGFDAILANPQFAGADTSYFVGTGLPFVAGGGVGLKSPHGILADLRSSKDEGQSNFNNPGTILVGIGGDFDVLPQLRVTANINHIWFENTAVLEALRQQGSIPNSFGWDYSLSTIWRPRMTQNVIFRLSAAVFSPDSGFNSLLTTSGRDSAFYSVLFNTVLAF